MSDFTPYTPKNWASREFITRQAMNHLEDGVAANSQEIQSIESAGYQTSSEVEQLINNTISALTEDEIKTLWAGE